MLLWKAKITPSGTYTDMKTPSTYKIDFEDLDNKSYRSISTGNLIDTVISIDWHKIGFSYKHLTESEVRTILQMVKNHNPIYIYAVSPLFNAGYIEAQFRCSKASVEMLEDHCYSLSFNLVQKKKVSGQ